MNLSEMYKLDKPIIEEVQFHGATIGIRLFSEADMKKNAELAKDTEKIMSVIGDALYEDGKSYTEMGITENVLNSMPMVRSNELLNLIMSTNGIGKSVEDVKKK